MTMHTSMMMAVNPASVIHHRDPGGPSAYRSFNSDYTDIQPRAPTDLYIADQSDSKNRQKKDKKWSIGKLFRRKKKDDDSASSSESDNEISWKKKQKKKKKPAATVSNFDIVVNRDDRRAQSLLKHSSKDYVDEGVLSDPSAGFVGYRGRPLPLPLREHFGTSKESLSFRDESIKSANTSLDGSLRKTRKGRIKARVEALRNSMRRDSSSDEDSQKSSASSTMQRFKSEDSLMHTSHGSLSKRSRSARTERYIKRLSRDEENQLNKEAELLQQGYTKAEVEMLTRTPTSQSSGYGTCKKENGCSNLKTEHLYSNGFSQRRPMKSESVSSFPSTHSHTPSVNLSARSYNENVSYSMPYANINREPFYANTNNNKERAMSEKYDSNIENIMCVKLPLGNVTNFTKQEKVAPTPPPRDMTRKVSTPLSFQHNNDILAPVINRPVHGVPNNDFDRVIRRSQERSLNPTVNGLRRPLSNSVDHIAMQSNETLNLNLRRNDQPRRPASVSAEPNHYAFYVNAPWRNRPDNSQVCKPEPAQQKQDYLYFADQSPRSRRPISIKSSQNNLDKQYLSDSQTSLGYTESVQRKPRNASEFWKKIDDEERVRKIQNLTVNGRGSNDPTANQHYAVQRASSLTHASQLQQSPTHKTQHASASGLTLHKQPRDAIDRSKMWKATTEYKHSFSVEVPKCTNPQEKTHIRHKSDTQIPRSNSILSDEDRGTERRKSTNLDDALNELEAIYNSLGLGDEDLLDRAERRELMTPKYDDYNDWNGNDKMQLRSQPTTPLKRVPRRATLPDKLQDDMAFRRLNSKDKPQAKETSAQISYMLASPVYVPYASDDDRHSDRREPDVVHDDVVYRNIKHMNNHLKLIEPQPPFGIPLGPISPAPQSDYLHATPDNRLRPRFIPRRSPDLVSDDLAYRTLRKDNRHSALFSGDDCDGYLNNNHNNSEALINKDSMASLKKKRAVRSLSANIFTMIQKEIDDALNLSKLATIQKTQSTSEVNNTFQRSNGNGDKHQDYCPRNKVKHRHNTVNIFVSSAHSKLPQFAKDDSFVSNDDKYLAKPPTGEKSKSSSPATRSPQTSKKTQKDEFQQVLTMLAQEAMDTSNKLGVALAELDKNRQNSVQAENDAIKAKASSRLSFLHSLTKDDRIDNKPEVKLVSIRSEIIQDSRSPCGLEVDDRQTTARETENSLLAISDQLNKVEDKLKHSIEKELNFADESLKLSECHFTKLDAETKADHKVVIVPEQQMPDILVSNVKNDSIVIENEKLQQCRIQEETRFNTTNPFINQEPTPMNDFAETAINTNKGFSNNPFLTNETETKIEELNEMTSFKDLKEGISDLIAGISQVNEKLFKNNSVTNDEETKRNSATVSLYEDDFVTNKTAESTEYNSSEELAGIFNLENNRKNNVATQKENANTSNNAETTTKDDQHEDLSSPRLVQSMNQQLRRFSTDSNESNPPSQNQTLPSNVVPWRTQKHNLQNDTQGDHNTHSSKRSWYQDPNTLMLACTYTLIYSQQLAELDWLTLLGLILAMISCIAMLLI